MNTMTLVLNSSHVAATNYQASEQVMVVQYTDGSLYQWKGIPPAAYAELCAAESVGKHLHMLEKQYGKGKRME